MERTTKMALVTGANRGMGLETCRQLTRLGYQVILTSRDETRGEAGCSAAGAKRAHGAVSAVGSR